MTLELKEVWNVEEEFKDAITALVDAAAGERVPRRPFNDLVYGAAQNVAVAYQSEHAVHKGNYWCVDKNTEEAIRALVETVFGESARGGLYGEAVYEAAKNFTKVFARLFGQEFKIGAAEAVVSLPFAATHGEFVEWAAS